MRCHYIYDEVAGKVLIPGCWGTVESNDIEDCICQDFSTFEGFQRKRYNEELKKRNELITELEKENLRLNNQIKKLLKL